MQVRGSYRARSIDAWKSILATASRTSARGNALITSVIAVLALSLPADAFADACTSNVASGNWGTSGSWTNCGGSAPGAGDTAVILSGHTITANAAVTVDGVTVNAGGTLIISGTGSSNWNVTGPTSISGTLQFNSTGGSSVFGGLVTVNAGGVWNDNGQNEANSFGGGITNNGTWSGGTGTQTFSATQTIGGSSAITFGGNVSISSSAVVTNMNTVRINGILNGSNATSTWLNGANSTLNYANATQPMGTGILSVGANMNTVNYLRTGNQTIRAAAYHDLAFSGSGTKAANGALTINGNLNIGSGTILSAGGFTHLLRGNLVNNGTYTHGGGFVTMDGSAVQSISGTSTTAFSALTIANTSAAVSVNSNIAAVDNLTINANGVLSPAAGVIVSGAGGTLSGSGTARVTMVGTSSDFNSQYTITNKTLTNLTVEYAGASAQNVTPMTYGGLTVNNSAGVTLAAGMTTVNGTLTLSSGTLTVGSQTLVLNGPSVAGTPGNLTTTSASNLTFGGSSTGVGMPAGVTLLNNLTVNNANGITLNSSPTVSGTLTLTSGPISTGSNVLKTSANCPGSVSRPGGGGYVLGKLRLTYPAGTVSCTYHVGSSTAYAPMSVNVTSTGGTLTGQTTGNEHQQIALSGIDSTKDVNRYWTLGADAGDTINVTTYGITFNFTTADVDIAATPTSFKVGRYAASTWSLINPSSALSTSTSISSVAGPIGKPTDFAIGEATPTCDVPAYLPSNMSCVCDTFGRATLNPSTIFGGNWAVSSSSGTFGSPRIVNSGYLRMTDNSTSVATAATMPGTFPAAGNLITVEFKHYAYNAAGSGGADGIALTLSDATIAPVPGAYGGSLGYAQKDNAACSAGGRTPPCNGFTGGWVGIGIDEWGNFSAATEGRVGGPGQRVDSVSVRGSGSLLSGYPYLGGTAANLSPGIDSPTLTTPNPGHVYRITVDARNYTWNGSSGNKTTLVSVERDTTGNGNSFTSLVPSFDAFVANPSQASVPANWKLSFTGSTGAAVNYHEIGSLKICAQTITPPAGYRIEIDNLTPSTCGTAGGNPSSPVITVTAIDANGNNVTTYANTVTLSATLIGGGASAAVWTKKPGNANGVLSGNQYTFDPSDFGTAKFYLTDASSQDVQITVSEIGGTISSSSPSITPIQYRGGLFTVTKANDELLNYDVVGGRPHNLILTRTTCAGGVTTADANYDGAKLLDGWYTPDANHPTGAYAPQICAGACAANGSCSTLSIAAPNLTASSNNLPALSFTNGVANFCLKTSDVGKYSLFLRDDSIVSAPVTGASPVLTVRPFAVAVSNVNASGTPNQAVTGPADTIFTTAGSPFSATVQGYLWSSNADLDGDGLPGSTNLDVIATGGIALHYADTVKLSSSTDKDTEIWPNGGNGSSVNLGEVAVTGGTGVSSTLTYPEVGSFVMKAAPSTAYLGTSLLDLAPRVVIFAKTGDNARNGVVGRFRVHHFEVTGTPTLVNRSDINGGTGCSPQSGFTYMDEPMRLGFTLTARSASGTTTTQNYSGTYSRLTGVESNVSKWTTLGASNSIGFWMNTSDLPAVIPTPLGNTDTCSVFFGASAPWNTTFTCTGTTTHTNFAGTGARIAAMSTGAPTWTDGVATFTANAVLQRGSAVDGPYGTSGTFNFGTLNFGIWPQDEDGATLNVAADMDGDGNGSADRRRLGVVPATQVRFGRLRLSNANGSELLPVRIPVEAQFWNGRAFVTNRLDSCTSIPSTTIGMNGYLKNLSACETAIPANVSLTSGEGRITLPAPGSGNNGSVDLTAFLGPATAGITMCPVVGASSAQVSATGGALTYLQGNWRGVPFVDNPTARATFGVFRSRPTIYFREIY